MDEKVKLNPNIFSYPDFEHSELHMEISLGGVNKEDITLRMYDDGFFLHAPMDKAEYVASMAFCCPVRASEARARYENGMLKIIVPFKDQMENRINVKIE